MLTGIFLLGTMGCDTMGSCAARIAPPLEQYNPSWGEDPVDCEEERNPPKKGSACSSETFTCNQGDEIVIEATTIGGPKHFGDGFWQGAQCTPARKDYEKSPEAIYKVKLPPNTEAKIRLDRNCDDDMIPFAIEWEEDKCPQIKDTTRLTRKCTFPPTVKNVKNTIGKLDKILTVDTGKHGRAYLIGVDGQRGAQGNFRLTIRCEAYK